MTIFYSPRSATANCAFTRHDGCELQNALSLVEINVLAYFILFIIFFLLLFSLNRVLPKKRKIYLYIQGRSEQFRAFS